MPFDAVIGNVSNTKSQIKNYLETNFIIDDINNRIKFTVIVDDPTPSMALTLSSLLQAMTSDELISDFLDHPTQDKTLVL